MSDDWMPFGLTETEAETYAVLVPGVPTALREALIAWLSTRLADDRGWVQTEFLILMQMETALPLGVQANNIYDWSGVVEMLRRLGEVEFLRVVDYVLSVSARFEGDPVSNAVEGVLFRGRSKWAVGLRLGRVGLVERVPAGVQEVVENVIRTAGSAGEVLARAWSNVHALVPLDSSAYADAVRATEISAIGVVQPRHESTTLGTVIGQMKADGDWRLPLREHSEAPGAELVLAMIRTLWFGHRDRHGSPEYSDVSHEEARAAVVLAATLVDWFESGALARRPAGG